MFFDQEKHYDKTKIPPSNYNYIERERQLGGTLYRYLFFKKRRKKYGIKDYRGQIRNRVSIESRPEIVAERSRLGDWEGDLIMGWRKDLDSEIGKAI